MSPIYLGLISLMALLILLGVGVPIFVSLGVVGVIGIILLTDLHTGLAALKGAPYAVTAQYLFILVPLYVSMGHFAFHAGITTGVFDLGRKWLNRFPGGLALATIVACAAFGAACGSSVASAATMGKVAIPEMRASGYDAKLACGVVAAGGLLAIMIPPSTVLVLYAVFTNNSVGHLLIGGLFPGIMSAIVFLLGISFLFLTKRSIAPPGAVYSWKEKFSSLKGAWRIAVVFGIVTVGMYAGIFTATEAGAAGTLVAFIMLVATRNDLVKKVKDSLTATVRTTSFIFIILVCAQAFSQLLVRAGLGQALSAWASTLNVAPLLIVVIVLLIYIPLGMFLEPASCLLITLPIVYPIVVVELGFSPIWFGILVTKLIEIGLLTPPVGLNVYVIASVAPDIPLSEIFKATGWFIIFELVSLAFLLAFPAITIWLPSTMIKG